MKGAKFARSDDHVLLKSGATDYRVVLFEFGMTRFNDFRQPKCAHNLADGNGRHVLGNVCHPGAHDGIDGRQFDVGEGLAILQDRERRLDELEITSSDESCWMSGEFTLAVGGGQESLREKSSEG